MKRAGTRALFKLNALVACCLLNVGITSAEQAPATAPTTAPTSQPAKIATLQKGVISYEEPGGTWVFSEQSSTDTRAAYVDHENLAILALQVLPVDAQVDHAAAVALCGQLKADHNKRNDQVIKAPAIEVDKRFTIRIHEIYKHEGQIADELHLYRKIGPFACMMTVNAASDDSAQVSAAQHVAEQMLLSVKVNKPVKKRPAKAP